MVVLSKIQLIRDFPYMNNCKQIHFTGNQSCSRNLLITFINAAVACSKYYIPVYILQLALIGRNNLTTDKILNVFWGYVRSVFYGGTFPVCAVGTCCIYSLFSANQRIDVKTLAAVCILVGCNIFVESKRNRQLNAYMLSTMALEVMVNELETHDLITRSPLRDTLKFMAINGLVMYFLARKKLKSLNFWFYDVEPIKQIETQKQKTVSGIEELKLKPKEQKVSYCQHQNTCVDYLKEGFKKYFVIGYGWNIIKLLLKQSSQILKQPKSMPLFFVKLENFKFGSVLGLYAVTYRYIMCNLVKIDSRQSAQPQRRALHSAVAGALAASTYIIEPNLQFGLTALVTLLQIFYEELKATTLTEHFWSKVPGGELCFIVMVSYLNVSYVANTVEINRANCKHIYDTFSGNIASKFRTAILQAMKLID